LWWLYNLIFLIILLLVGCSTGDGVHLAHGYCTTGAVLAAALFAGEPARRFLDHLNPATAERVHSSAMWRVTKVRADASIQLTSINQAKG